VQTFFVLFTAGCLLSSIIWFSVTFYNNTTLVWAGLSDDVRIEYGYSFYLASTSGALVLILAIACCAVCQNMAPTPVVVQAPQVGQMTMVVMAGNQQMAPQPPPQQYPYGQPLYANPVYNYPAVVVAGQSQDSVSYIQPQRSVYQSYPAETKQQM